MSTSNAEPSNMADKDASVSEHKPEETNQQRRKRLHSRNNSKKRRQAKRLAQKERESDSRRPSTSRSQSSAAPSVPAPDQQSNHPPMQHARQQAKHATIAQRGGEMTLPTMEGRNKPPTFTYDGSNQASGLERGDGSMLKKRTVRPAHEDHEHYKHLGEDNAGGDNAGGDNAGGDNAGGDNAGGDNAGEGRGSWEGADDSDEFADDYGTHYNDSDSDTFDDEDGGIEVDDA